MCATFFGQDKTRLSDSPTGGQSICSLSFLFCPIVILKNSYYTHIPRDISSLSALVISFVISPLWFASLSCNSVLHTWLVGQGLMNDGNDE